MKLEKEEMKAKPGKYKLPFKLQFPETQFN